MLIFILNKLYQQYNESANKARLTSPKKNTYQAIMAVSVQGVQSVHGVCRVPKIYSAQ